MESDSAAFAQRKQNEINTQIAMDILMSRLGLQGLVSPPSDPEMRLKSAVSLVKRLCGSHRATTVLYSPVALATPRSRRRIPHFGDS
jgi:hypothetical protein